MADTMAQGIFRQHANDDAAQYAMNPPELITLGDYAAPTMPTEHVFRGALNRLKQRMSSAEPPLLERSVLKRASLTMMDDLADPPDCGPLLQTLDAQLGPWLLDEDAPLRLRTLVVPPCDTTGLLERWARLRGHALLAEPDRIDLLSQAAHGTHPDLSGNGLLVIPRLEYWFLRHHNGMHAVRSLLSRLARADRRCLVGCNSWAWRLIVKGAGADLALPRPQTFAPFDARRLHEWFSTLALDSNGIAATFRLAGSGEDVLACGDDGEPYNAYLRQLAARSGGIPWIAWHLWRASLTIAADKESLSSRVTKAVSDDARTVWVVDVEDLVLPSSSEDRSLQVLHALLIHGALTLAEIDAVMPTTGDPDTLAALVRSGHLRCDQHGVRYTIRPTAYPAVRSALQAAGFPMGGI